MANFLSGLGGGGNQGIAKVVGKKAGVIVEDTVNKVLSGNKEKANKGAGGTEKGGTEKGGFDVGDVLSFGGNKDQKGGLDVGDALSLVGGSKGKGDGGLDLSGTIGDFMK